MKLLIMLSVVVVALLQVSNAARPIDAPHLCEIQIDAFLSDLNSAKTDAEKEQVKKRWRNKRPAWIAACVSHLTGNK